MNTINRIVDYYIQDEITQQELRSALEGIGFSAQIVDIHIKIADQKKERIQANDPHRSNNNHSQDVAS